LQTRDHRGLVFKIGGLIIFVISKSIRSSSLVLKTKKARRREERLVILEVWRSCGAGEIILQFPGFHRSGLTAYEFGDFGTLTADGVVEIINLCLNVEIVRGLCSTWLEAEVVGDGESRSVLIAL
jgi:hypothetical protein